MTAPIDPVAMARAVIADPRKKFTISADQIMALCQEVVAAHDQPVPAISIELADAARSLIQAEATATIAKGDEGYVPLAVGLAREMAFLNFKSLFEQEFPNE